MAYDLYNNSLFNKPLDKQFSLTRDPMSFKSIDIATQCQIPIGPKHCGAFGYKRKNHIHEGVDLYAMPQDNVYSMFDGLIVSIEQFTGPSVGMPWWFDTQAIAIQDRYGVTIYGEIEADPFLNVGDFVFSGQLIGTVSRVLREDKGRPTTMLHIERYRRNVYVSCGLWSLDQPKPQGLVNPTPCIMAVVFGK